MRNLINLIVEAQLEEEANMLCEGVSPAYNEAFQWFKSKGGYVESNNKMRALIKETDWTSIPSGLFIELEAVSATRATIFIRFGAIKDGKLLGLGDYFDMVQFDPYQGIVKKLDQYSRRTNIDSREQKALIDSFNRQYPPQNQ